MKGFETRTYGKWILAGEHAVLRGVPALVFPLTSRFLTFSYLPSEISRSEQPLHLNLIGEHGKELQLLFWSVLQRACEIRDLQLAQLRGEVRIDNNIPLGAGMGASAAFCVAVARWVDSMSNMSPDESQTVELARQLENLFHGESSGVDIAVAITGKPLYFVRHLERQYFKPIWSPKLYISYSGQRGVTSECVQLVKEFITKNPDLGQSYDKRMQDSVEGCLHSLTSLSVENFEQLAKGINQAADCFTDWGLVNEGLERHMTWLRRQGAVAVKPTGSGRGGYVLSLWQNDPPVTARQELLSCF